MTIKVGLSHFPQQKNALHTKAAALFNKATSNPLVQSGTNRTPTTDSSQQGLHLESVLTQHDKEVLNYAVGGVELKGSDGMMKLNFMAINIAIDRAAGQLSGEVDIAYMRRLALSQKITGEHNIASSSIDRAIEFLERK